MTDNKVLGLKRRIVDFAANLWYAAARSPSRMPEFQRERFNELVLYITSRSADDPNFGRTKLAKLLMFSDFEYYARTREPLTGATYRKKRWGPYALELRNAERELMRQGRAHLEDRDYYGKPQKRLVADAEPGVATFFPPDTVALVDRVIARYWNESAAYLSTLSHDAPGWRIADENEEIPYESAFLGRATEADFARGRELAALHDWE